MRFAAVHIPFFAVVAHRRRDRDARRRPLVLVDRRDVARRAIVVARSPEAAVHGVVAGMSATAAAAGCPQALVRPIDLAWCRAEHERIRSAILSVAPQVEDESLGSWCFVTAGLGGLYPNEAKLAVEVRRRVLVSGYASRVAVAAGRFTAVSMARFGRDETRVVPAGREAGALSRLPAAAAPLDTETRRALAALGVRTLGDFAELPDTGVRARFGVEAERAHCMARGLDPTPLAARPTESVVEAFFEFETPTSSLDEALFRLRVLCDRVMDQLAERGLACAEVLVDLLLDGAEPLGVRVRPSRPTLASRTLWTLIRLKLDRVETEAEVKAIRLAAVDTARAQAVQRDLFLVRRDTDRLEAAVARLVARFGEAAIVSPVAIDAHRPEGRLVWRPYRIEDDSRIKRPVLNERDLQVCRFEPLPRPLTPLRRFGRIIGFRDGRRSLSISAISHPERLDGEWWEQEFSREYRVVRAKDGVTVLVFRDLALDAWFLQGEFD